MNIVFALFLAVPGAIMAFIVCPDWVQSMNRKEEPQASTAVVYIVGIGVAMVGVLCQYFGTLIWHPAWGAGLYAATVGVALSFGKRQQAKLAAAKQADSVEVPQETN